MPFQKGNKFGKGAPKKLKTQYEDWIKDNPQKVSVLLDILYQKGLNGDKEAAIYVIDRILGRPRQEIDQRIKGQILITPDMRVLAAKEMIELREEEIKLLGVDNAIEQSQG